MGLKRKKKGGKTKNSGNVAVQMKIVFLFAVGLILFFLAVVEGENLWKLCHNVLLGLFGVAAFFIGICIIVFSVIFSSGRFKGTLKSKLNQMLVFFIMVCSLLQSHSTYNFESSSVFEFFRDVWSFGLRGKGGGVIGGAFNAIFSGLFGKTAARIVFWILLFVFVLTTTSLTLFKFFKIISKPVVKLDKSFKEMKQKNFFDFNIPLRDAENYDGVDDEHDEIDVKKEETLSLEEDGNEDLKISEKEEELGYSEDFKKKCSVEGEIESLNNFTEPLQNSEFKFPSVSLLNKPTGSSNCDVSSELKANAARLVDTLHSFGVETRVTEISRGPTVTRYELQPSVGVKISRITNLADDISLNLASQGVRIEAPIPNKAAVGIEVPNKIKNPVLLREIIASNEFKQSKSALTFALGKDIAGNVIVADIATMPHVLIAGATGSGKSVCINSIIVSMLYKSSPDEVKLLLIDPKVVELGVYNSIPHLLIPVVTDPKKAAGALGWAIKEMLHRYSIFAETGVRDLFSYNNFVESGGRNADGELYLKLPQIVIVIDELADLMMAASKEVENSICRLAQMARAAGMHLVIATQRPSVDVITGLIKANIPSRIAFTVSSQVDSRTILDSAGAEKLLGAGDMLYNPINLQKPIRIQGCFLSDKEIERVVKFIKQQQPTAQYCEEVIEEINNQIKNSKSSDEGLDGDLNQDPLFMEAAEIVVDGGQASISFLQRKLKLGYSRAARIMDELESCGVVGAKMGSKPREILITKQTLMEMKLKD